MRAERSPHGFTLIEVLVATAVLALMAVMSWRGIDAISRSLAANRAQSERVAALQFGLEQVQADLDAQAPVPGMTAVDWNGRALRLVRRADEGHFHGVRVVAWQIRTLAGRPSWMRWQSALVVRGPDIAVAWQQAQDWTQSDVTAAAAQTTVIAEVERWQLQRWSQGQWIDVATAATTPLTTFVTRPGSKATPNASATPPLAPWAATFSGPPALPAVTASGGSQADPTAGPQSTGALPAGLRFVLTVPPSGPCPGVVTKVWLNPTTAGPRT